LGCILYEMVTLRHAFDANSMKGLVLKILRGNYPPIPSTYSKELNEIIADMLIKDPVKRPSMRKILEKEILSKRISKLLTSTIAKNEFSNTFVTKHLVPHQEPSETNSSKEESKQETQQTVEITSNSQSVVLNKQKIVLTKETGIKPKSRLQVVQSSSSQYSGTDAQDHANVSELRLDF